MQPLFTRRGVWIVLLLGAICAFEFSPLDFWLQDHFYDPLAGHWWVDKNEPLSRALFYSFPKAAIIAVGIALIAAIVGPTRWRSTLTARGWHADRRRLILTLIAAGSVPVIVGLLKSKSNVYCPYELVRYGGFANYNRPFGPEVCGNVGDGCWPAGHASGGFALIALTLLATSERQRAAIAAIAFAVGWAMGLYQMFKGAHFMSHTLVTFFIALTATRCAGLFCGEHYSNVRPR